MSQEALDSGRRFCFLFTDAANPTSNHIYQEIGYEHVRDVDIWEFERAMTEEPIRGRIALADGHRRPRPDDVGGDLAR